jgi:hypothetical protein
MEMHKRLALQNPPGVHRFKPTNFPRASDRALPFKLPVEPKQLVSSFLSLRRLGASPVEGDIYYASRRVRLMPKSASL